MFIAFVLLLAGLVFGPDLGGPDRVAQASQPRVTICHRTKSTTNPYRQITVSVGGLNGHLNHTGPVWAPTNNNGDTWGDIVPGNDTDGRQFWSPSAQNKSLNWDASGKSFMLTGGANVGKCIRMSAQKFYEVMKAAGRPDSEIAADLEEQRANEDAGVRPSGGWTASNVAEAVGSVSITTNSPTALTTTSATLSGTIVAGTTSTTPKFEWGTTSSLGSTLAAGAANTGTINASAVLSELSNDTTYYYRVIGEVGSDDTLGTYYGEIVSFTTGRTLRTITLDVAGGTTITVSTASTNLSTTPSAGSAGTTTYTVVSGSLSCTVSGSVLTTTATPGTCKLQASDAGDATYSPAVSPEVTVTVNDGIARTLSVSGHTGPYALSDPPPTMTATPSDGTGTITYLSNSTSVCTINASTGVVAWVNPGTCSIYATITSSGGFASATASAVTFVVNGTARTLTLSGNNASYARNATPPTMVATASAGGGTKTFSTTTPTVCDIDSATGVVDFLDEGTCTIEASIAASNPHVAATATAVSFAITAAGGGGGGGGGPATTVAAATTTTTTTTTQAPRRITICHATGSASNPYVQITVDAESLNGHGDHAGDIIPAPAGGCSARAIARAAASTATTLVPRRITICHATGSATNPYVEITVDVEGLNGHGDHEGDIIPAPAGGCSTQAINAQRVTTTTAPRRITICHATGSATNPYVEITVDANGLNGHGDHEGDIIPAPADGCPSRLLRNAQRVTPSTTPRRITICHATGSASNPYVEITVDANSLSGHGDHPGDIVPAPAGGCGLNNVLRTIATTTTLPAGSLGRTQQQVNDTRNGGQNQIIANNLQISGTPTPAPRGGGGNGGRGGSITLQPRLNSPSPQLLNVRTSDPRIRVEVRSSGANYNQPSTWVNEGFGSYCWKIEPFADSDYTYVLPNPSAPPDAAYAGLPYSAVVVKAGSVVESDPAYQANTVFMNPSAGATVFADVNKNGVSDPGGQGGGLLGDKSISHIVLCVGDNEFPEIAVTMTTVPGGSGTTTTTVAGGGGTTTTIAGGSGTTTTTVAGGSGTTTTIAPGASSPTTTSPGATPSTLPEGSPPSAPPPLQILLSAPLDVPLPPRLEVELFLTTGTANERLVLTVFTESFEIPEPYSTPLLLELPETGVTRWTDRQMYGFGFITFGLGLWMFGATRRLRRR